MANGSLMAQQNDWPLAKQAEGVTVYTKTPNEQAVSAYKGETLVNASTHNILTFLKNVDNFPNWLYSCTHASMLDKVSELEYYSYTISDFPWPMNDRDSVMKYTISKMSSGTVVIKLKSMAHKVAEKESLVRLTDFDGAWTLVPQNDNTTLVYYEGNIKIPTSVPNWVVSSAIINAPFSNLASLKKHFD